MPTASSVVGHITDANIVEQPQLVIIANDPILAPTLPISPSRSRVSKSVITFDGEDPLDMLTGVSEHDPLLGGVSSKREHKKPFYRPRPLWIVPFAILAAISRGMTIAPRVEVFMQLSCNAVYGHPPHFNDSAEIHDLLPSHSFFNPAGNYTFDLSAAHSSIYSGEDAGAAEGDNPLCVPSKRYLSDPAVQSYAARLQTIMATSAGLLSALTTGWWGHSGERYGRTRVLAAATLGLLLTDVFFVLASTSRTPLAAHGQKLLLIAPILEGLLGGWSTLQSATFAYISDCTSDGSRSHIFSRFMGVFYFGFSIGPMLGAWIITHPPAFLHRLEPASVGRTVTPVFWLAVCFSLINFLLSLFVFPESLGKKKGDLNAPIVDESEDKAQDKASGGILSVMKGIFIPLLVFAPKIRPNGRDWNMTLLALALFGYLLSSGIFSLKYLYAEHVFAWEVEQLSYYITFVGGVRAVHLLFIMPSIISYCKPKPKKSSTQLQQELQQNQNTELNKKSKPKPTKAQLVAEMKFDLRITQLSYAIDVLSHTLVSLSSTAPNAAAQAAFIGFTMLSSLGSGVMPSVQSLALCVMQADAAEDERLGVERPAETKATGSLFGALSVLQATGQMILGPMLFGLVYSTTVASFPKGIFLLAACILAVSLVLLVRIRPPFAAEMKKTRANAVVRGKRRGNRRAYDTWAAGDPDSNVQRGRSRASKDLSGNSGLRSSFGSFGSTAGSSSSGSGGGDEVIGNGNVGASRAAQVYGGA